MLIKRLLQEQQNHCCLFQFALEVFFHCASTVTGFGVLFHLQIAPKVLQRILEKKKLTKCVSFVLLSHPEGANWRCKSCSLHRNWKPSNWICLLSECAGESTSHQGTQKAFFVQISRKFTSPKGLILIVLRQILNVWFLFVSVFELVSQEDLIRFGVHDMLFTGLWWDHLIKLT